jgi:Effector-associated domain 11
MDEQSKDQIRDLVSRARLDKALELFSNWADEKGDKETQNTVFLKIGEYTALKKEENLGFLNSSEVSTRRNRIAASILSMLDEAEEKHLTTKAPVMTSVEPLRNQSTELKTILFMGANPPGARSVQLEIEHSRIATELKGRFNLPTEKFLSADQIPELIIQHKPYIVHFSGHGKNPETGEHGEANSSTTRAIGRLPENYGKKGGIVVFSDNMLNLEIVDDDVLDFLFSTAVNELGIPIQVVVFNSCYSESQASVIGKYIPYVVGTANAIKDDTAIAFASGFYFALAQGLTVEKAYATGRMKAVIKDIKSKDLIVLYKDGERQKM